MADPLTSTLRLTQPTVGGDSGAWGGLLNADMAYIDAGVNGILGITCSTSTLTLEAAGDGGDQARYAWYNFTGTPGGNCTVTLPTNQKIGIATNGTTGGFNVILTTGSGATLTIQPNQTFMFYCDGTNVGLLPWSTAGVLPAVAVTGNTVLTVGETSAYVEVTSGAPLTITLPAATSNAGVWYHIYNSTAGTVTLSASQNFQGPLGSGSTTLALPTNRDITVVSDGTSWMCFGQGAAGVFTSLSSSGTLSVTGTGTSSFTNHVSIGGSETVAGQLNVTGVGTSTMSNLSILGTLSAGSVQATSTATTLFVSSTSQFGGTATFSSAVDVLGTLTCAVLDVTGTSSHVGSAIFGNLVTIAGSLANAGLTVNGTGTSTMAGGLSIGAGLGVVGTGTINALSVSGTAAITTIQATGTITGAVLSVTGTSTHNGNAIFGGPINVTGTSSHAGAGTFGANLTAVGTTTTAVLDVTGTSSLVGNVIMGAGFSAVGTGTMAVLSVTGTSTQNGAAKFGGAVTVVGTGSLGALGVSGACALNGGANIQTGVTVGGGASITGGVGVDTISASANEALVYFLGTATAITGPQAFAGWTKVFDRVNASFNTTNGIFTSTGGGFYNVGCQMTILVAGGTAPANAFGRIALVHTSGTTTTTAAFSQAGGSPSAAQTGFVPNYSVGVDMLAGDVIYPTANVSSGTGTVQSGQVFSYFSVMQVP